jgi:hypothetical protein
MRSLVSAALIAFAMQAAAQLLTCPPPSSQATRACELFHYHVALFRPDPRGFAEVWGTNQFASQAACDRARDAAMKRNLAVVDHMKRVAGDNNFEPDRFGPCHCDGSVEPSMPTFLNDAQRLAQMRTMEEVRQRVRERLLDSNLTSDSELVRSLYPPPVPNPLIGGPRVVPPPQSAPVASLGAPADLRITKAIDASKPSVANVDLPLVDVMPPGSSPPVGGQAPSPVQAAQAGAPAPAPEKPPDMPTVTVEPPPAVTQSTPEPQIPDTSAEDAADNFIGYETQRIQNVLKAAGTINDEAVKSKIFDACLQRTQLLSNLRALILGAGTRSRLAADAGAAKSESERVAFVSKLFGNAIAPHWAAKEATDVIIEGAPEDPEKVLRDHQADDQQKRRALYFLLARSQPTEEQQLWLSTLIDGLLQ